MWTRLASSEPLAIGVLIAAFWLVCAAFWGLVVLVRWLRRKSRGSR